MIYHVFTNNHDEYFTDKRLAFECFELFVLEYGNARLYEQTNEEDDGDCIKSHGNYPQ